MRIAFLSFGHVDSALPLFKYIRNKPTEIDLFLCFSLNRKSESILDFTDKKVQTGFLSKDKTKEILSDEIKNYLGGISSVKFFIYHNQKLRSFKNFFLSLKLVNELKKYDIIHFNGTNGVLPLLIYLLRKHKLVFTIHDMKSHSGEKTRFNFAEKMNEFIIKSEYPLIVQNLSDYEYLRKRFSNISHKFNYIPFGVLDIYCEFKGQTKENFFSDVLFFGRISPYKGIEFLIEAINILQTKGININTIIAGAGQPYFDIENFDRLNIRFINKYIANKELVNLIENTKMVICPYTDATQSGVVMTAYAFNKPVIATPVGGLKEVVIPGITGLSVPPRDPVRLAESIIYLLTDTSKLEEMSCNIEKFCIEGEFAWDKIAQKTINVYKKLLGQK